MLAPLQKFSGIRQENGRTWKLILTYGFDWLITIGLTGAFFLLDGIEGFRREFDLNDSSYAVHERIPNWMLLCICFIAPICLLPVINFFTVRSLWDWHTSSLGLILALGLTGTVTNVVKICVGRPRPDLIDRCQPLPGSVNNPVFGLSNSSICTQTDAYMMRDGFRSFPSGHSSLSFAGLGFLSFYIAGKIHLFDERGYTGRAWLCAVPLVGAALTAVSRTMDYRHHWQDVTTGSVLGLTIGFFAYRQFYPSLTSPRSHKPYSPRIPRESAPPLPMHHRRFESGSNIPLTQPESPRPREDSLEGPAYPPIRQQNLPDRQYSTPVNLMPYEDSDHHDSSALLPVRDPFSDPLAGHADGSSGSGLRSVSPLPPGARAPEAFGAP